MQMISLVITLFLLGACNYSDRPMYGEIMEISTEEQTVQLDITDWSKEAGKEDPVHDILLTEQIQLTDEMIIKFEHDQPAEMADLFIGQQVTVLRGEEKEEVAGLLLMEKQSDY